MEVGAPLTPPFFPPPLVEVEEAALELREVVPEPGEVAVAAPLVPDNEVLPDPPDEEFNLIP